MDRAETLKRTDVLTDEVVYLMPRPTGGDAENKGRFDFFMIDGTKASWRLPKHADGRYVEILNGAEREFFEKELRIDDLSFSKKSPEGQYYNPYWANFEVAVVKDDSLMSNGRKFYMRDPIDNIAVRILKTYAKWPLRDIAPSKEELPLFPEVRWYLTTEKDEETSYMRKQKKMAEAYTHFGSISGSVIKMIEFIRLYGAGKKIAEVVDHNSTNQEYLTKKLMKILDEDLDGYLEIARDHNTVAKLFIEDAIACGAMFRKDGSYTLKGGDPLNPVDPSIDGTIEWYQNSKENPDTIFTNIYSKVEKYRNKIVK